MGSQQALSRSLSRGWPVLFWSAQCSSVAERRDAPDDRVHPQPDARSQVISVFDERSGNQSSRSMFTGGSIKGKPMSRGKQAVLDLVKALPDNCTLEEVQYRLYVRQKIERSMQAVAEGRVHSHEQVKKRLAKWIAR